MRWLDDLRRWLDDEPPPELTPLTLAPLPPPPPAARSGEPSPAPMETSMHWLDVLFSHNKKLIGTVSQTPEVQAATETAVTAAKTTVAAVTASVDPILTEMQAALGALIDAGLAKAGVAGQAATPAVDMIYNVFSVMLHSAVDAKLNISPAPVTTPG